MREQWATLTELDGTPSTLASEGYAGRAAALQSLVRDAHGYLRDGLGTNFDPLVVVADATDWALGGEDGPPYGIPYASGEHWGLVIPADHRDNFLVEDYATSGSREDAERFADLIATHELGHLHARALGLDLPQGWLSELVATYLSCCFLATHQPADAELWFGLARSHAEGPRPEHHSLEELDELYFGVGPANYIWYQDQLTDMVERVQPVLGLDFVLQLNSAGLGPDSDGPTVLAAVEALQPGFASWAASLRG